jgi:branched-chain amino acid transport system substrate-binding protein
VPSVAPTAQQEGGRLVLMLPWTGGEARAVEATAAAAEHADSERERRAARLRAEAAVEVWADAARRAASAEPDKVAEAARAGAASTVVGPIRFDEVGDARVPSYVPHIWRDGAWRPLARSP